MKNNMKNINMSSDLVKDFFISHLKSYKISYDVFALLDSQIRERIINRKRGIHGELSFIIPYDISPSLSLIEKLGVIQYDEDLIYVSSKDGTYHVHLFLRSKADLMWGEIHTISYNRTLNQEFIYFETKNDLKISRKVIFNRYNLLLE